MMDLFFKLFKISLVKLKVCVLINMLERPCYYSYVTVNFFKRESIAG